MKFFSNTTLLGTWIITALLAGCAGNSETNSDDTTAPSSEVEITSMKVGPIVDKIEVSATSTFQAQSVVKSPIAGFIVSIAVSPGQPVGSGNLLMKLQTKESRALGNALDSVSGGLNLSGIWSVKADAKGFVSEVSHQVGDYVPEGEPLVTIVQQHSLAFVLNLPFEWRNLVQAGMPIELTLADGSEVQGRAVHPLPQGNSGAQTITWLVAVSPTKFIPAGIQAVARIPFYSDRKAQLLPKNAVLTNETQTSYWVMKLINDSTAVKVSIKKGVEVGGEVEILQPAFSTSDRIIVVGNYGLADTAKVHITKR